MARFLYRDINNVCMTANGRARVYCPECPYATKTGMVLRYRYVLWKAGVEIPPKHDVHHKDGNRLNDALENLEVMPRGKHTSEHHTGKIVSAETRAKLAQRKRERIVTAATRAKIAEITRQRERGWHGRLL